MRPACTPGPGDGPGPGSGGVMVSGGSTGCGGTVTPPLADTAMRLVLSCPAWFHTLMRDGVVDQHGRRQVGQRGEGRVDAGQRRIDGDLLAALERVADLHVAVVAGQVQRHRAAGGGGIGVGHRAAGYRDALRHRHRLRRVDDRRCDAGS